MYNKVKVGTELIGTDGTVVETLSRVSKRGFAKVKVIKQGTHLNVYAGTTAEGFQLFHGIVKFDSNIHEL